MKKSIFAKSIFALTSLFMIALASCTRNASEEAATAKTEYCDSVAVLQQDLAKLNSLPPSATVAEVQAAEDRVELAVDRLTGAEIVEQGAAQDELKQAHANLVKTIESLPSKDTVGQAATQIQQAAAQVDAARVKLASGAQCL